MQPIAHGSFNETQTLPESPFLTSLSEGAMITLGSVGYCVWNKLRRAPVPRIFLVFARAVPL
ncbi:MAG: hypothetical protein C4297_12690 [Gemmataceae bacterium]